MRTITEFADIHTGSAAYMFQSFEGYNIGVIVCDFGNFLFFQIFHISKSIKKLLNSTVIFEGYREIQFSGFNRVNPDHTWNISSVFPPFSSSVYI